MTYQASDWSNSFPLRIDRHLNLNQLLQSHVELPVIVVIERMVANITLHIEEHVGEHLQEKIGNKSRF